MESPIDGFKSLETSRPKGRRREREARPQSSRKQKSEKEESKSLPDCIESVLKKETCPYRGKERLGRRGVGVDATFKGSAGREWCKRLTTVLGE